MVIRLTVLTAMMALFAVGFSSLVALERPANGPVAAASGECRDAGLVCALRTARTGL